MKPVLTFKTDRQNPDKYLVYTLRSTHVLLGSMEKAYTNIKDDPYHIEYLFTPAHYRPIIKQSEMGAIYAFMRKINKEIKS